MNMVEKLYNEHIDSMTIQERFAQALAIHDGVVMSVRHQILKEAPDLDEYELSLRVAEILYLTDRGAQQLIKMAREARH